MLVVGPSKVKEQKVSSCEEPFVRPYIVKRKGETLILYLKYFWVLVEVITYLSKFTYGNLIEEAQI